MIGMNLLLKLVGELQTNLYQPTKHQNVSPKPPDAKEKHDHITILKVGKLWVFKHCFDDEEHFKGLIDHHNGDECLFEFKTSG